MLRSIASTAAILQYTLKGTAAVFGTI